MASTNCLSAVLNFVCIAIAVIVFFTLKSIYNKRKLFSFASTLKGYRFYPIIGNGYHFIKKDVFSGVHDTIEKFGSPCNMWVGHEYFYATADAMDAKILLNHPNSMNKAFVYEYFKYFFGESSLLLLPAEPWKRARRTFAKSFSQPILNSFVDVFDAKSKDLCEILKRGDEDKIEIFKRFTVDTVLATIFGIDYKLQGSNAIHLDQLLTEMQDLAFGAIYELIFLPVSTLWFYTNNGKKFNVLNVEVQKLMAKMLEERRAKHKEKGCIENKSMMPLLDAMLESHELTDQEIHEQSVLFIGAATDTSGANLGFFFILLGMNPEIQEKVYEEIVDAVGFDGTISYQDLPKFKYLERVISESMRLFPVTPLVARQLTDDIDLGPRVLPKEANVVIDIFAMHRSEKYYKDPKKFDPDRFLPEEVKKREEFGTAYIPFSGGPRNCIGKTYALMVMKVATANIIRKYKVVSSYKSIDEIEIVSLVSARPKNGSTDYTFIPRNNDSVGQ